MASVYGAYGDWPRNSLLAQTCEVKSAAAANHPLPDVAPRNFFLVPCARLALPPALAGHTLVLNQAATFCERNLQVIVRALKKIRPDLPAAMASGFITDELRLEAPA